MYWKRGLRKILADNKPTDLYNWYLVHRKSKAEIPSKLYHEIVQKFNHLVLRGMIYEQMEFVMPGRLGTLSIMKNPYKMKLNSEGKVDTRWMNVDWKKTKERWLKLYPDKTAEEIANLKNKPVIFEYNEHTDRYRFFFMWNKLTSNVQNQTAYYIEIMRPARTELAKALKEIPELKDKFYSIH